jgi:hypothetical protein
VRSLGRPLGEIVVSNSGLVWLYICFFALMIIVLAAHARLVAPAFYWVLDLRADAAAKGRRMPSVFSLAWTGFFVTQCIGQAIWAVLGLALPPSLQLGLIDLAGFGAMQILVVPAIETALLVAAVALAVRLLPNRVLLVCLIVAAASATLHAFVHPLSAVPGFVVFFVCGRILTARTDPAMTRAVRWSRAFVVHSLNNAFAVVLIAVR